MEFWEDWGLGYAGQPEGIWDVIPRNLPDTYLRLWGNCWLGSLTNQVHGQSPSWEPYSSSVSHKIPRILWNPKVHYRVHNSLVLVSVLSRVNQIGVLQAHFFKIHFNITPHLRLDLPCNLFPSGFPTKNLHAILVSPNVYVPHAPPFSFFLIPSLE